MQYLNDVVDVCNERLRTLNTGLDASDGLDCDDLVPDSKIQIIPHFIFIKDEYGWNCDNDASLLKCPTSSSWHLNYLNNQIHGDPNITKGINVYLTNQGDIYNQLVTLGTIDNPEVLRILLLVVFGESKQQQLAEVF